MPVYKPSSIFHTVDWFTIVLYILMVAAGWLSICGASYDLESGTLLSEGSRALTQLQWIVVSAVVIFFIMMLDFNFFDIFAFPLYWLVIALLILTIFIAPDVKGSHSWLVLGPIRLQPAEFAKFSTALVIAHIMGGYEFHLTRTHNFIKILCLIFLPMVCILLQRETGSALVYFAFFLMLYREGMSGYILLAGICSVVYFVVGMKYADVMVGTTPLGTLLVSLIIMLISMFLIYMERRDTICVRWLGGITLLAIAGAYGASFLWEVDYALVAICAVVAGALVMLAFSVWKWVWHYAVIALFALISMGFLLSVDYVFNNILEPHQQLRIKVSLGLEDDPSGAGYNVNQSKIAIGSGGFLGKGFLNGTQTKLRYVPEQETDFIFCTVGEEQGFVGSVAVLVLFATFIIRLFNMAERQDGAFGRVYGYSVASIFLLHLVINIGMVIGLTPVIGIPLPFFSYGGSSLLGFTILLFIFIRIDASRRVEHKGGQSSLSPAHL